MAALGAVGFGIASGFSWARRRGKAEQKQTHAGAKSPKTPQVQKEVTIADREVSCVEPEPPEAPPPAERRLKFLVKWAKLQILAADTAEKRFAVLDEVVRPFSVWVQEMYLAKALDPKKKDTKTKERSVQHHLYHLFDACRRKGISDTMVEMVDALQEEWTMLSQSLAGPSKAPPPGWERLVFLDRCRVILPTVMQAILHVSRTHQEASELSFGLKKGSDTSVKEPSKLPSTPSGKRPLVSTPSSKRRLARLDTVLRKVVGFLQQEDVSAFVEKTGKHAFVSETPLRRTRRITKGGGDPEWGNELSADVASSRGTNAVARPSGHGSAATSSVPSDDFAFSPPSREFLLEKGYAPKGDIGDEIVPEPEMDTSVGLGQESWGSDGDAESRIEEMELPPDGAEEEDGADVYLTASEGEESDPSDDEDEDEAGVEQPALQRCWSRPPRALNPPPESGNLCVAHPSAAQIEAWRARKIVLGEGACTWTPWDAGTFDVRGPRYLQDRKKVASSAAMFETVDLDLHVMGPSGAITRTMHHPGMCPQILRAQGDKRFLLVQNWVFPPYQCVITAALNPEAAWAEARSGIVDTSEILWLRFPKPPDYQMTIIEPTMNWLSQISACVVHVLCFPQL